MTKLAITVLQWCCDLHQAEFLSDCLRADGSLEHLCAVCCEAAGDPLVLVNVVRGLHRRASDVAAERKETA
jgi:hypothetical protein